ncbi:hypothetical protein ACLKA6_004427 [Drosophila palustris]
MRLFLVALHLDVWTLGIRVGVSVSITPKSSPLSCDPVQDKESLESGAARASAATSGNLTGVKVLDSCECAAELTAECPLMSLHWTPKSTSTFNSMPTIGEAQS